MRLIDWNKPIETTDWEPAKIFDDKTHSVMGRWSAYNRLACFLAPWHPQAGMTGHVCLPYNQWGAPWLHGRVSDAPSLQNVEDPVKLFIDPSQFEVGDDLPLVGYTDNTATFVGIEDIETNYDHIERYRIIGEVTKYFRRYIPGQGRVMTPYTRPAEWREDGQSKTHGVPDIDTAGLQLNKVWVSQDTAPDNFDEPETKMLDLTKPLVLSDGSEVRLSNATARKVRVGSLDKIERIGALSRSPYGGWFLNFYDRQGKWVSGQDALHRDIVVKEEGADA